MSCERAGDAILDELGLTLRSSKAQVGKKFPKKRADVQRQDTLPASSGSISGQSNTNPMTSHAGTSSDVAQLVDCRCVGRANGVVCRQTLR